MHSDKSWVQGHEQFNIKTFERFSHSPTSEITLLLSACISIMLVKFESIYYNVLTNMKWMGFR